MMSRQAATSAPGTPEGTGAPQPGGPMPMGMGGGQPGGVAPEPMGEEMSDENVDPQVAATRALIT